MHLLVPGQRIQDDCTWLPGGAWTVANYSLPSRTLYPDSVRFISRWTHHPLSLTSNTEAGRRRRSALSCTYSLSFSPIAYPLARPGHVQYTKNRPASVIRLGAVVFHLSIRAGGLSVRLVGPGHPQRSRPQGLLAAHGRSRKTRQAPRKGHLSVL